MTAKEPRMSHEAMTNRILYTTAKLFLTRGYTKTTQRAIAREAGINIGSLMHLFPSKEELLCALVHYVIRRQFASTAQFLDGITEDPVLFYAAETTLQLYMAESSEYIRDLYSAAYSMPKSSAIIQEFITDKVEQIFAAYLPGLEKTDFYMLEIASGGIMRGFMTIPCSMWFTMEKKVAAFLQTTMRVYQVPQEKIQETIAFVGQFDYPVLAKQIVDRMFAILEERFRDE